MSDKLVLVTGASRGLGFAICKRLVEDGYRVIGVSRSQPAELAQLAEAHKERFLAETFDVSDLAAIPTFARRITDEYGPLFGLVNNAGIGLDGVLSTQHASEIERVIRTNLLAPINLTKYFSRPMLQAREGRIINISSIIGSTGFSGLSVYAASKSGLTGFTKSLSRELGRVKITVNAVAPGYMETEMTGGLQGGKLDSIRRRSPLGLARVEDAAGAVAYLLSPDGARVTGTVITVDGGSTA